MMLYSVYVLHKGDGYRWLVCFNSLTGGYVTNCVYVIASGIILDGLPKEPLKGGRLLARLVRYCKSHLYYLCHFKFTGSFNLLIKRICQLTTVSGRLPLVV